MTMSMLSVMCERLRNIADNLSANGYTDTVRELRDAADVIDDLRRKCQDVQAENERLRETMAQMVHNHAEQGREVNKLKALIRDMQTCINHVAETAVNWDCTDCPLDGTRECDFEGRMITMGIEVE